MLKTQKIIIYLCPGHQHSEFVPWLLNHSPDCDHGFTFDLEDGREFDRWTEYTSSYGQGWEPKESHWHLHDDISYDYKQSRHQPNFPSSFFSKYVNLLKGVETLYFNIPVPAYEKWVTDCRQWFLSYSDIELVFAGHYMNLNELSHPSLYFIKEGYILDKEFTTRQNVKKSTTDTVPELRSRRPADFQPDRTKTKHYKHIQWLRLKDFVETKNKARNEDLQAIYKKLEFDRVWNINDILNDTSIIFHDFIRPPALIPLTKQYLEYNLPDYELDVIVKELLNSPSDNNPYKYKTDFLA